MSEYKHDKLYFLKLPKGFFKRHDMLILEAMPNGKEYSLFYLKMILESLDHNGYLRYNELIPYNAEMLAAVTNTNIDIVRVAVKTLEQMQLIEVLDDQTIYMQKVAEMTISTTEGALKRSEQRENKQLQLDDGRQKDDKCHPDGRQKGNKCPPEYRDKSIDMLAKDIKNKINRAGAYTRGMFDFEFELIENALKYGISLSKPETYAGKLRDSGFWSDVIEKMDDALLIKSVNALHNHHPDKDGIRYALGVLAGEFIKIKK